MRKLKIITATIVCMCVILTNSAGCSALDVSLNAKEENHLLYYKLIRDSCQGKEHENRNCTKYIARYDGLDSKIAEIKELAERKYYTAIKDKLEKGGAAIAGTVALGAGIYLVPLSIIFKVFIAILGCASICTCYSGANAGVSNLFKRIIGKNVTENNDKGLFDNALEVMFGNKMNTNTIWTSFKSFFFGKDKPLENVREIKETEAFKKVLNEFYSQVKERKFQGKNVLIISMDFTDIDNIESKLKFAKTYLNLGEYPKKDEDYFKKWL